MNIRITYVITFIVAYCSIVYELLLAQTLSMVLGNTVLRYSLTIGCYLAAMGMGAMLCSLRERDAVKSLLKVEIALIVIGGLCVVLIYIFDIVQKSLYLMSGMFQETVIMNGSIAEVVFFILSNGLIVVIGIFSGFEIPLLIHIGEREKKGTTNVVLGVNYFGALAGAILFPLLLLPRLGIFSISFSTAILNGLAGIGIIYFKGVKKHSIPLAVTALLIFLLVLSLGGSETIKQFFLKKYYFSNDITKVSDIFKPPAENRSRIEHWQTPYQHIELISYQDSPAAETFYKIYSNKWSQEPDYPKDKWLFMNSSFQFFSLIDEIYHEYFVHIPIIFTQIPRRVCILGGGDGLVARELLKYKQIKEIVQVELDPAIIKIAKSHPTLFKMNKGALLNPRVKIFIQDAFHFMRNNKKKFDAIYIDFPTPNDFNLSILYSKEFYTAVRYNLEKNGFAVMDMPDGEFFDREGCFQIYYSTVKAAGFRQIVPITTTLEINNRKALSALDEHFIATEIDAVNQQFLFMSNSNVPLNKTYKDMGVELYVLNDKRFKLALQPFPDNIDPAQVNSIFKPTLPRFHFFDINFPF